MANWAESSSVGGSDTATEVVRRALERAAAGRSGTAQAIHFHVATREVEARRVVIH